MEVIEIPEGWTEHDGQGCPVEPALKVGIMFRAGTDGRPLRMQPNYPASYWQNYGQHDCWNWLPGSEDGTDIVAYRVP